MKPVDRWWLRVCPDCHRQITRPYGSADNCAVHGHVKAIMIEVQPVADERNRRGK